MVQYSVRYVLYSSLYVHIYIYIGTFSFALICLYVYMCVCAFIYLLLGLRSLQRYTVLIHLEYKLVQEVVLG